MVRYSPWVDGPLTSTDQTQEVGMDRRGFIAGLGAAGAAMMAKAEATGIVSEELAEEVVEIE